MKNSTMKNSPPPLFYRLLSRRRVQGFTRLFYSPLVLTLPFAFAASLSIFLFSPRQAFAQDGERLKITKKIRVMIDPGHGGEDDGAAFSGIKEKNITLKVALELRKLLQQDKRFEPVMTRESDVYISLNGRSEKAAAQHANVFLSIHANSSPEAKAKGTEFYFENQAATDEESLLLANKENNVKGPKTEDTGAVNSDLNNILTDLAHNDHMVLSQQLSQNLLESFQRTLKIKTRAIRQAPFRVLSVTMPATLIELGFISNPSEGKWLSQPATQKDMARAIYNGLKAFKEKLDKARSTNLK